MRNTIQGLRPGIKTILDLRLASCKPKDRRSKVLRPEIWIFSTLLCLLSLFMISGAVAQATRLRVINAKGEELPSLEILSVQSTKYVLEEEVTERFNGTRVAYKRLSGRVIIAMNGKQVVFTLRQHKLKVDDEEYVLSQPPDYISGKIVIPVEFLDVVLPNIIDSQVTLDQKNWVLKIGSKLSVKNGDGNADLPVFPGSARGFRVIIDPGHGGSDTGSRTKIGRREKDLTLKIAQQVKNLLATEENIDVYLTRSSDRYMTSAERINLANDLHGRVYLSIHFNWSPSQRSKGFRIYVNSNRMRLGTGLDPEADMFSKEKSADDRPAENRQFLPHSKRLAKEVAKRLRNMGLTGQQEKEVFLADMDDLSMPGILVEVLYFSSQQDLKTLSKPAFTNSVSRSFRDSILAIRDVLTRKSQL